MDALAIGGYLDTLRAVDRTRSTPMRFALGLVGAIAAAPTCIAQVSHISASREVRAWRWSPPDSTEQVFSTTDFGAWEALAVAGARAYQQSTIDLTGVTLAHDIRGSSGPGVHQTASTGLIWTFSIQQAMRWDLTYSFGNIPEANAQLVRLGQSANLLPPDFWQTMRDTPRSSFGFLEAGDYRLSISATTDDTRQPEFYDFRLSVPAPFSAFLGLAWAFAAGQRRR